MQTAYRLMHGLASLNNKSPEYEQKFSQLKQELDKLTEQDVLDNAKCCYPFLHESAHQLLRPENEARFDVFKLIWCHPIFKKFLNTQSYRDEYRRTALQSLSLEMSKDQSSPQSQFIMKTFNVKSSSQEYDKDNGCPLPITDYIIE